MSRIRNGKASNDWDPLIDTTVAHPSRMYDYLLGGVDHFVVDREAVDAAADAVGGIEHARATVRANRRFLVAAVRWLTAQGIRQFLDIGTGIPTMQNVHQVAQEAADDSRVVYVDNDPIVLAHAHTLLKSTPRGATAYIYGDLRDPEPILTEAARTLDLDRPIALILVAIVHFFPDEDQPQEIVARLLDAVPPGSYLALSHLAADIQADEMAELERRYRDDKTIHETFVMRTHTEVARFFHGLELIEPGVVGIDDWLRGGPAKPPDEVEPRSPDDLDPAWVNPLWAAIGRKP